MKKKCLILFKWRIFVNKYLINKFSKYYHTECIYLDDFKNENFSEIVNQINDFIKDKKIDIVFFDVDFMKFFNSFFIEKIKNVLKVLFTYDDHSVHEMNAITASACDYILSQCPLSVLKYKEKGYQAYWMLPENDGNIFKNYNLKKEIDILFFGVLSPDRKEFLDYIQNRGLSVKIIGHQGEIKTNDEELIKLISKSKIVLNLSKSTKNSVTSYHSTDVYKFSYQLKGRVTQAALCGTLCVSEYAPGHEIIFSQNELPTFYTKEQCLNILDELLKDSNLLSQKTDKFCSKVINFYEEKKNFEPIFKALDIKNSRKIELISIPFWYLRIVAKQIIVRNIKFSKFLKTILLLGEVYKLTKNSKIHIKFLVFFESILNIIWYSARSIIK